MEALLIIIATAFVCVSCFIVGAKVGQKVVKGEAVEIPLPSPMKAIRERQERKAAEAEQDKIETIMQNIERYDGTPRGQEDVPRG